MQSLYPNIFQEVLIFGLVWIGEEQGTLAHVLIWRNNPRSSGCGWRNACLKYVNASNDLIKVMREQLDYMDSQAQFFFSTFITFLSSGENLSDNASGSSPKFMDNSAAFSEL